MLRKNHKEPSFQETVAKVYEEINKMQKQLDDDAWRKETDVDSYYVVLFSRTMILVLESIALLKIIPKRELPNNEFDSDLVNKMARVIEYTENVYAEYGRVTGRTEMQDVGEKLHCIHEQISQINMSVSEPANKLLDAIQQRKLTLTNSNPDDLRAFCLDEAWNLVANKLKHVDHKDCNSVCQSISKILNNTPETAALELYVAFQQAATMLLKSY